jgi:hypothetical protein
MQRYRWSVISPFTLCRMQAWELGSGGQIKAGAPLRWTAPHGWPEAPFGWAPPFGWQPEPSWKPAPHAWAFWRLADTAADSAVPMQYRTVDLDAKIRPHIVVGTTPAATFQPFLDEIAGIAESALHAPDAAAAGHSVHRDRVVESVAAARLVLADAVGRGLPVPFLFFACVQDATTAGAMFAAELAARSTPSAQSVRTSVSLSAGQTPLSVQMEAQHKGQVLFDGTVKRVMAVFHRAVDEIRANRAGAAGARRALLELKEVERLINHVGDTKSMALSELLAVCDALDACGQRAAANFGARY